MILNNRESVVLLSLVSRVMKNNNEEKNNVVKNVHQDDNNYGDKCVDITSATKSECLELYMK